MLMNSAFYMKVGKHGFKHGSRHRRAQMKYFSGSKFRRNALRASQNASWRYARINVLSK